MIVENNTREPLTRKRKDTATLEDKELQSLRRSLYFKHTDLEMYIFLKTYMKYLAPQTA